MRYIKENTSKLKDIPGSWAGRIKTVKTSILLCTTDLMQFLSKLQWQFSEKQKKNPKIHIEPQRSQIVKVILRRKIRTRSIMFPIFKLHYETKAIKTLRDCHKNRHIDQWNRRESRNRTSHFNAQSIYNLDAKRLPWWSSG